VFVPRSSLLRILMLRAIAPPSVLTPHRNAHCGAAEHRNRITWGPEGGHANFYERKKFNLQQAELPACGSKANELKNQLSRMETLAAPLMRCKRTGSNSRDVP